MIDLFTRHPRSLDESYIQHLMSSSIFGFKMFFGGFFCLIHGLFPFLFQRTGSNMLFSMVHDYVNRAPSTEERIVCLFKKLDEKTNAN